MTQAVTLLQMQGAPDHPAPLADAVLVLIDVQEEYRSGALPLAGATEAAVVAGEMLALARDHDVPVIHVRHNLTEAAPIFNPSLPTFAFMAETTPLSSEVVIDKARPNAFSGTGLDDAIRRTGRHELILAGMQTHLCISATARAASDLGYRTTIIRSACATRDLPDGRGGVIDAGTVHDTALAELADAFATVVDGPTAWSG